MATAYHLIDEDFLKTIGRPLGKINSNQLDAYITEAEQMYAKPALGDELFLALHELENEERYATLLDGGVYSDKKGNTRSIVGLRTALAYYVYAQNVMCGDIQSTRYGMVVKEGDYSSRLSGKERSDAYNNSLEVANTYLRECVAYCREVGLIKKSHKPYTAGGVRIKRIGR